MPIGDYLAKVWGGPFRKETDMGDGSHAQTMIAVPPADMVSGDRLKVQVDSPNPLPVSISGQPILVNLPDKLITDGGIAGNNPRFRVDVGQTGFFDRRMWALNYEFASANPIAGTPLVFRLVIPTNFIIHAHSLTVDQGGVTLRTYAASQGTPGGTFSTSHPPVSENSMTESTVYAFQSVIDSGGTFTPTVGQSPLTPLRVRTANATAQQSSVGGESVSEKARSAGTYYAVLSRMTSVSGDCTGVYTLVIEERP